jgi:hypothetical protein
VYKPFKTRPPPKKTRRRPPTRCAEREVVYPSSVKEASWCVRMRARTARESLAPRRARTAAACVWGFVLYCGGGSSEVWAGVTAW